MIWFIGFRSFGYVCKPRWPVVLVPSPPDTVPCVGRAGMMTELRHRPTCRCEDRTGRFGSNGRGAKSTDLRLFDCRNFNGFQQRNARQSRINRMPTQWQALPRGALTLISSLRSLRAGGGWVHFSCDAIFLPQRNPQTVSNCSHALQKQHRHCRSDPQIEPSEVQR